MAGRSKKAATTKKTDPVKKKSAGRPNKYEINVKPRFDEIREMLEMGATEKEVAENLGVNYTVFIGYKTTYPELNELVKSARVRPIQQIKAALFKKACGFHYNETTVVMNEHGAQTTTYDKYSPPDTTAALILLKHWDKEDNGAIKWKSDPATYDLKKEELEFKKKQAESEAF